MAANISGKDPNHELLLKKWGWTDEVFNSIAWEVQEKALRQLPQGDQTRIIKFVHGWLPTQHRLRKEGIATSSQCKLCETGEEENNMHILTCEATEMEAIQQELVGYIQKTLHDYGNSEMSNIMEIGLSQSARDPKLQPLPTKISQDGGRE
jgi:hypothetical protein